MVRVRKSIRIAVFVAMLLAVVASPLLVAAPVKAWSPWTIETVDSTWGVGEYTDVGCQ